MTVIKKVFDFLVLNNKTISFAESCTGGNLSSSIVKFPGSSNIFLGSIVSYSKSSKLNVLGINQNDLELYSTVSHEIAVKMAEMSKAKFFTDFSIAVTGNAGPSTDDKTSNVGDYYVAIISKDEIICQKFHSTKSRVDFIEEATTNSFKLFTDKIINQ